MSRAVRALWPLALIGLAAFVVWSPTLAIPAPGDSFGYDLEWSRQFSQLLLAGDAYPRWMPASFDGLGSPAFYFYPPLPFFVVALISGAAGGLASAALQLKLAGLALFAVSGWSMYAWLRAVTTPVKALIGALVYLAAPYHFDDHFLRGDLAEFAAMAVLPLVALGLKRTADGARLGAPLLAAAYAVLILAHLPLALLASLLLTAPYGLFLALRAEIGRWRVLATQVAALAAGAGLAGAYLVPALTLQGAISADYWWSARFQPADGVLTNPHAWSSSLLVLLGATAIAEGALAVLIAAQRPRRAEPLFWGGAALLVLALLAGVWPGFWSLPLIAKVQFPWRAMALGEFALVTVIGVAPALTPRRLALAGAALVFANPALLTTARMLAQPPAPVAAAAPAEALYTPEYLPAGMLRIERGMPVPKVGFDTLRALPLVAGAGASAEADPVSGALALRLAPGPARTLIARRFYFPSWQASCDGRPAAVHPIGPARLAAIDVPAGASSCSLAIGLTPAERLGWWISLASGLALAAWLAATLAPLATARRRPPALAPAPVA